MRIGELSRKLGSKQGTRDPRTGRLLPSGGKKEDALADAGISTSTAHRYEQLVGGDADVQARRRGEVFGEAYLAECRANGAVPHMDRLRDAERQACEIRLRAERKAMQLYRTRGKAPGAREPGTHRGTTRSDGATTSTLADLGISKDQSSQRQTSNNARAETLADLGISYDQSSRWQKLAAEPSISR